MKKRINIPEYFEGTFEPSVQVLDTSRQDSHTKVASEAWEYIKNVKAQAGKRYILVIAMGAGEYWGANKNADYFPEADLLHCYKNFETTFDSEGKINGGALIYKHHRNKLKEGHPWFGVVQKAFYNKKMHRVELLLEIHGDKGQDIIDRVDKGETLAVSMGVRIPYDVCVHEKAEVVTPQGLQPICEIKLGDQVLTHKNRFRKVTRLFKNPAPKTMVSFRATGDFHRAIVTANHPMYVLKRDEIFFPSGGRRKPGFQGLNLEPKWVDAGEVGEKDYLLRAIPTCGDIRVDPKFAYLVGHYLGDGHLTFDTKGKDPTKPMSVTYTTHLDDRQTIVRRLADYALDLGWDVSLRTNKTVRPDGKTVRAISTTIRNREFAKFCNDICGTKKDKHVPDAVFEWDQESIKNFLGGYVDADGCFRKHQKDAPGSGGTLTSTSVLEVLSRGMQTLFHMVGMSASIREDHIGKSNNTFSSATVGYVVNIAKSHAEKLRDYSRKITTTTEFEGQGPDNFFFQHDGVNYWAMKIREKEEIESPCKDVYNLTVEEDESYVADGFVTHNCSICAHKAKKREEYCSHLTNQLRQILKDGRMVCAINGQYDYNVHPKALNFFDISCVFRPADQTGYMLKKVASFDDDEEGEVVGSAELYDHEAGEEAKVAFLRKMSTIDKTVKGIPIAVKDDNGDVRAIRGHKQTIDKIVNKMKPLDHDSVESLSSYPMNKILSTLSHCGILLTTPEFVNLVVRKLTGKQLPNRLLKEVIERQSEAFDALADDPEKMAELEAYSMFEEVDPDSDIEEIVSGIRDSRDLTEGGIIKKANTDMFRSVLDINDAQFPGGDGKGMLHGETYTDPKSGKAYHVSQTAVADAQFWRTSSEAIKAVMTAALLGGVYVYLESQKSKLAPIAGVAALAMGAKQLKDLVLPKDDPSSHLVTDQGQKIPRETVMREKVSFFKKKKPPTTKEKINKKLKSYGDSSRMMATFAPMGVTKLLQNNYENRLQTGRAGLAATDLEQGVDTAGRWAYTHPILMAAGGTVGAHMGLNALSSLRRKALG